MNINIDKKECVDTLHRMSAHLGQKLGAPELVASCDDDTAKIDTMWNGVLCDILNILSPYATMAQNADGAVYTLTMPSNWKNAQSKNLVAQCVTFAKQSLFARWLDYVKADTAALYRTLNQNIASAILHILALRKKPER